MFAVKKALGTQSWLIVQKPLETTLMSFTQASVYCSLSVKMRLDTFEVRCLNRPFQATMSSYFSKEPQVCCLSYFALPSEKSCLRARHLEPGFSRNNKRTCFVSPYSSSISKPAFMAQRACRTICLQFVRCYWLSQHLRGRLYSLTFTFSQFQPSNLWALSR